MSTALTKKRFNAVPRRAVTAFAAALIASLIATASASAQVAPPTTTTTPAPSAYSQVFPISTSIAHYFGDGFGAGRGKRAHQGVDVFAACGAPLIANSNGRVVFRAFHPAAGNYIVIRYKKLKQDYMYAHLAAPAIVLKNQRVIVGQQVGSVGATGNASGCHLHFELWLGKWYRGGRAINPLPALTFWDSYS